ncbi:MAG: apolipoprotein N-acyltransferase [Candidatus Loosdrechtia sp.]|uniref:apolipoprotein N-acyltransferase n=1 Tax=Candidatus Loosdrechtia sp. TaxID=3101272 RepID=UPI003A75F3E0|nr:MAG: apolipoprotein N-acyltransferase [Candidatus Jettenia sp. AMX2]
MHKINILKICTLSFLTFLLFYLSFPPADLGYLAWIAFVPWFILIVTEKKFVYLNALLIGLVFFFVHLSWLRHVTYAAWFLLSLYCSVYFLLFMLCVRPVIFKLKWPLSLAAPCTWVALEFIRSFFLSGFPWFFVGHTQYRFLPVIQISDITGVYGISFIIIMVNASLADFILRFADYSGKAASGLVQMSLDASMKKSRFWWLRHIQKEWFFADRYAPCLFPGRPSLFFSMAGIFPVLLLAAMLFYGHSWLRGYIPEEGPLLGMVQGNIPQDIKHHPSEEYQLGVLKKHYDLSMSARGEPLDLLVWPETMVPGILNIGDEFTAKKIDILSQLTAVQLASDLNTNLVLGAIAIELDGEESIYLNSAFYYDRKGQLIDRYDKIHLVPFGEFTPLKEYFPFLTGIVPYEVGLTHGKKRILFHLDTLKEERFTFGVSICYEDTVPPLIRKFRKDGADFMLNITNDGWFRDSAELDQHLAIMVFRAVENRFCMVRAANTGISSFVSPDGAIYAKLTDPDGKYREISGVLIDRIRFMKKYHTFYTNYGDCFSLLCMAALGGMLCTVFLKRLYP